MVNIEESQNTTVITGNTKLMMRIAGVLFAVLAVIHIALTCTPEIISNILMMGSKLFYYLNIVVEIFFSIACIIQKKSLFFNILANCNRTIFNENGILHNQSVLR